MRLFQHQAPPPSFTKGVYIWVQNLGYAGYRLRLLLVGSEDLYSSGVARRLYESIPEVGRKSLAIYPNYIACTVSSDEDPNEQVKRLMGSLGQVMGDEQTNELGRITTPTEFQELNERHQQRWPLGR